MKKRNDVYDALKLIFAITIFLNHCSFLLNTPLCKAYEVTMHNGRFGVCFFFMCSGYCLYKANAEKLKTVKPLKFAIRHVQNIFPLYMTTNIVWAVWELLMKMNWGNIFGKVILSATMLQTITIKYGYILNAVGWYLSVSKKYLYHTHNSS